MRFFVVSVILTVVTLGQVFASGVYPDNYTTGNGYYYRNGYWRWGNGTDSYVRSVVQNPGYYYCGYYYPGYSSYQYTLYTAPAAPAVADYDYLTAKALAFAQEKDRAIAKERLLLLQQQNYLAVLKALGLEGNRQFANYGAAVQYPAVNYGNYGSLQLSSAGVSGNTVYGASYNSIASFYGDTNTSILYQALGRSIDGTQQLAGAASDALAKVVAQDGINRKEVAAILARGQAIREIAKTLDSAKVQTSVTTFQSGAQGTTVSPQMGPPPQGPPQGAQNGSSLAQWQASAQQRCGQCHSAASKRLEGGFNVESYSSMSVDQKLIVIGRILSPDQSKLMPKGGPRLPSEEVLLWLTN